jgi:hypothetical protein
VITDTPSSDDENSLDELFELLANERRRRVIYFFEQSSADVCRLDRLAEAVAWETAGDADRIRTELHHVHLPKLVAFGVVRYDSRTETVRYESDARIRRCLQAISEVR